MNGNHKSEGGSETYPLLAKGKMETKYNAEEDNSGRL
jgi:hypothetical protein